MRSDPSQRIRQFLANRDVLCPKCGYNLRNLCEGTCPECGFGFDVASLRRITRPRHRFLDVLSPWWAVVLLTVFALIHISLHGEPSIVGQILAWPFSKRMSLLYLIALLGSALWHATEETDLALALPAGWTEWLLVWLPRTVLVTLAVYALLLGAMAIELKL